MEALEPATLVAISAFVLGLAFGATSQITGFCTMGALADVVYLDDWRRLRAWMLALGLAVIGSQSLHLTGLIDLGQSVYLGGPLAWGGAIVGGLMFGIGMTLAGGCGAKTLVRLGGGNLKSLVVVLVAGLFAMMTLKGILAPLRQGWERLTSLPTAELGLAPPSWPGLLADAGLPLVAAEVAAVAVVGLGLVLWSLKERSFRHSRPELWSGVVVGLVIPAGWAVSGILGADPFEPVPLTSFSFAAPIGSTLSWLMTATGASLSFGVAATLGTVAGAFLAAASRGQLRLEGFADRQDLVRHLVGGALMGSGGVLALGCTIGQGLSGMSTLSLTSALALAAIIAGGVLNLKRLEEGSFFGALKALVGVGGQGGRESHPPACS